MENNSQSATLQESLTPLPPDAFNPLVSLLTALTLPFIVFGISALAAIYAAGHGETAATIARWASGLPAVQILAVADIAVILFVLAILPHIAKVPLRALGFVPLSGKALRYALFGALAMLLITDGLGSLLQSVFHVKVGQEAVKLFLHLKGPVPITEFAVAGVVLAPVAEEIVFRIFFFSAIRKYGGFWIAAVVSSILFGLAHFQGGLSLLQTGILTVPLGLGGVVLCVVYAKSGNAYASMITHGLFNAVALIALFFAPNSGL